MPSDPDIPALQRRHDFADKAIAGVTGLALALATIFLCVLPLTTIAGARDFVVFWATGQQLVHHANPYNADAMMRIEQTAGLPAVDGVMFMRNLPLSLPLVYSLGFFGLRLAAVLWSLLLLMCLFLSIRLLWMMHGCPGSYLHWLGISFAPAILCLMMGQTSLFALLGYVLFLYFHQKRPFVAGISLWLCALKPQLFLSFGIVLLTWIVVTKSYRVLAGMVAAITASSVILYGMYPAAWVEYGQMMRTAGIGEAHLPCMSVALRFWIWPNAGWLTWLPAALASAWGVGYFLKKRHAWSWLKDGSVLLLVSLLTAPYSWVYDDAVAIPALLQGAYLTRSRILLVILALASVVIEIELIAGIKLASQCYLWTAPTWFVWYLCATRIKRRQAEGI